MLVAASMPFKGNKDPPLNKERIEKPEVPLREQSPKTRRCVLRGPYKEISLVAFV